MEMATKEWRDANKDRLRASRRKWYHKNKKKAIASVMARKAELKEWYQEYRKDLHCEGCDEKRWYVLDFHHRDPEKKEKEVTIMIHDGWSKKRIQEEINKCDVLCANCHRELHFFQRSKE